MSEARPRSAARVTLLFFLAAAWRVLYGAMRRGALATTGPYASV